MIDDSTRRTFLGMLGALLPASAIASTLDLGDRPLDELEWTPTPAPPRTIWDADSGGNVYMYPAVLDFLWSYPDTVEVGVVLVLDPPLPDWPECGVTELRQLTKSSQPRTLKLWKEVGPTPHRVSYFAKNVCWWQTPSDQKWHAGMVAYSRAKRPYPLLFAVDFGDSVQRNEGDITVAWNREGVFTIDTE